MAAQQGSGRITIGFRKAMDLLLPYARKRVMEQVRSVAVIIIYLVLFQRIVLGIPIAEGIVIASGLGLVIGGLTFFMEGLLLGLMPLGEVIGVKLPQKSKLVVILVFSFILGVGATFAEPAVGILKAAGSSVKAWDAPLLFLILNKHAALLVYAVGVGVGIAVVVGMLRFLYNWSLKPLIYILIGISVALTTWSYFEPNMIYITGLAWDCGGVTTGPVTVPLVLALGIGVCRVVGSADSGAAGFGVVTLASLFPVLTVTALGIIFLGDVPKPTPEKDFYQSQNRVAVLKLFLDEDDFVGYTLRNGSHQSQIAVLGGDIEKAQQYLMNLMNDSAKIKIFFGPGEGALEKWTISTGADWQKLAVFGSLDAVRSASTKYAATGGPAVDLPEVGIRNAIASVQAILPLSIFLILVLLVILREKLPRSDEVILGLAFAVFGMALFNVGIELGLAKLGTQVGEKLPSSFKAIELTDQKQTIKNFDRSFVLKAVQPDGSIVEFFYTKVKNEFATLPFHPKNFDEVTKQYDYLPMRGPLFGAERGLGGIIVVLIFAFLMGYGATLAEPALNALGLTVEELTVGTFKKSLLMQAVAIGVGIGITVGVAKIIWDIPLAILLIPPYLLALLATAMSTEEFVNIGWDSAGVTTGPITVPLVLAMGLGISGQVGVVEGFGILAMASVCPILSVMIVGLVVNRRRRAMLATKSQPVGA